MCSTASTTPISFWDYRIQQRPLFLPVQEVAGRGFSIGTGATNRSRLSLCPADHGNALSFRPDCARLPGADFCNRYGSWMLHVRRIGVKTLPECDPLYVTAAARYVCPRPALDDWPTA